MQESYKLTSSRVGELFDAEVDGAGPLIGDGIRLERICFRASLEDHRAELIEMLKEIPPGFHKGKGGGWSFLNFCDRNDGSQWTGLHMVMEQLFAMASALGMAHLLMPRDLWDVLPGGMPYIVFDMDGKK